MFEQGDTFFVLLFTGREPPAVRRKGEIFFPGLKLTETLPLINVLMLNEREDGGIEGLMLTPVPRTSLYAAKCITLFCLMILAEFLTLALFILFFNVPIDGALPQLALVTLLGTVGLVCLGTTFAAMAVRTRTREVMLPLLLIPIAVPLLIAAVETTSSVLAGRGLAEELNWLRLLSVFDVLFMALGYLTFPAILEE